MQCPQCAYESQATTVRCPRCHSTFPRAALEELGHLRYTRDRLNGWWRDDALPARLVQPLIRQLEAEKDSLLEVMNRQEEAVQAAATPATAQGRVHEEATAIAAMAASEVGAQIAAAASAGAVSTPQSMPEAPSGVGVAPPRLVPAGDTVPLTPKPTTAQRLTPSMTLSHPKPTRPQGPIFSWKKVGTYVLSERTLNALLGLGAFLILSAAVVISTVNPTNLNDILHLAAMLGTTAVFYAAGDIVQQRLHLARTGATLLAIGAAFIPLDVWTLGKDILELTPGSIWVLASLLCLPFYLVSHVWLRDRAFALLTAVAGGSLVMSLTQPLGVAPIWGGCALVGLAGGYLILAHQIRFDWENLSWALIWAAQAATPAAMAGLLALRFGPQVLPGFPPDSFLRTLGALPSAALDYAVGTAWWLGAAFYALSAYLFPRRAFTLAVAWTIPCAYLFTLTKAPFGVEWYGVCLAVLAAVYLGFGHWAQHLPTGIARPSWKQLLEQPAYQVGLTLSVVAGVWPAATATGGVTSISEGIALWMLFGVYAVAALVFRHVAFRYAAAYLVPAALAITLYQHSSWWTDLPPIGFAALAACYLLFGRFALGLMPLGDRRAAYLALVREPVLQVAGLLTLAAGLWPVLTLQSTFVTTAEIASLAAVAVVYGAAAFLLDQRAWAYVCVSLLPVVYGLGMALWSFGAGASLLGWAGLATVLWLAAEVAARRAAEGGRDLVETVVGWGAWRSRFASPLFAAGYVVSLLAAAIGLSQNSDLVGMPAQSIAGLLLVCALYIASAAGRRSSVFLYAATWLFLLPLSALAVRAYVEAGIAFTALQEARLLALLGLGYLALAFLVDRAGGHYAKPLYLASYALSVLGVALSIPDRAITMQTLGVGLLGLVWSAGLVHKDRHPSYIWVVDRMMPSASAAVLDGAEMLFQYLAIWLFPVWLLLLQSLWQPTPSLADFGVTLALLAPVYVLLSLGARRIYAAYRFPWLFGGYALSAIGPVVALPDPTLRCVALAVSIALFVASALYSGRHEWLWFAATLGPLLLLEAITRLGDPIRAYGIALVGLSLGYGILGLIVQHHGLRELLLPLRERPDSFALPFIAVGQALCLAGLVLTLVTREPGLMLIGYALGTAQYAFAAGVSRRSIAGTPLAITLAVVYVSGMLYGMPGGANYGPALIPGLAGFLVIGEIFRRTADAAAVRTERRRRDSLGDWALPFNAILHLGAMVSFGMCLIDNNQRLAWWAIAALYGGLTVLRGRPEPLYPTIGVAIAAYLGTGIVLAPDGTFAIALFSLVPVVWVLFWLAAGIGRLHSVDADAGSAHLSWGGPAGEDPWARPFLYWGALTLAGSLVLSAGDALIKISIADLGIALSYMLLLAILSVLRQSRPLVWAGIALVALACEEALVLVGIAWVDQPAYWATAALIAGLLAIVLERFGATAKLWATPLLQASYATGAAALCVAVRYLSVDRSALQPLAVTMTVSGAFLLLQGIVARKRTLGYLGIGLLNGAYVCELMYHQVVEPQAFVLPVGLTLLLLTYLEWRRGATSTKVLLELAAVAVLLGTTLVQGCGGLGVDGGRYSYDTFLLLESVAVLGLGAVLRWKRAFFAASAALVIDVCVLLVDPLRAMSTWYLMAIIGFAMIGLVIFLEQRRRQIPLWIDEVRERLESWD